MRLSAEVAGRCRPPLRCATAAVAVALATLSAPSARADEPLPPPPDTNPAVFPTPPAQPNLLLIGAVVAAGWYGGAVGLSYAWPDSDGASALRIPVAGPYMALAETGCSDREPTCGTLVVIFRTALTAFSAVGQTGGVLAMVEGLFLPTRRERPSAAAPPPQVAVTPMVSAGDGVGIAVTTNF